MNQDWRDLPSIIAPPQHERDYESWLAEMRAYRERASAELKLGEAPVSRDELAWAKRCWVCAKWMTWDRRFLDSQGRLDAERFLQDGKIRFGGYDGVVLWQAYPRIGFDSRNQFDFYRGLAGGLPHLSHVISQLKREGVRVFVAYNPWDTGTRRESNHDGDALRTLSDEIGADGVFLDTLREGDDRLRNALLEGPRPLGLESELDLPPTALADHALSWMQWPQPPDLLGLLRNAWLSPGHVQHVIRRWHRNHKHELFLAWLNGTGMLVWENVFGSWNGWSPDDAQMVRMMRAFYRAYSKVLETGIRRPFVPLWPGVLSSEWNNGEETLWLLANPSMDAAEARPLSPGLYDGFTGEALGQSLALPPKSLAAIVTRPRGRFVTSTPESPFFPSIRSIPVPRSASNLAQFGMAEIRHPAGTLTARIRVRECGDYAYANFLNVSYPGLHSIHEISQVHPEMRFAIDIEEVSNGQFLEFMRATGYRPSDSDRLLDHWSKGKPVAEDEHKPVTFVDLDDARAYAAWKGKRLPTEWEWQVAATQGKLQRGSPLVWNWTESERSDGMTAFVMLKGGCEARVEGSGWYADGGPQEVDFMAKFIRICPGLDRCATIGFRCAVDL